MSSDRSQTRRSDLPPPVGPEEALSDEHGLLRAYARTRDEAAREELVRRFMPFARSLAMRYAGGVEPTEDLIQVASLGLVSALERFDPDRGVPFAAFAGPTILGELRRHFRDRVWTLRVPRGLQERIRTVEDAIAKLSAELERSPTIAEIADVADLTEAEVLESFEATVARRTVSLDQPSASSDAGDDTTIADRVGVDEPGYELVEDRDAIEAGAGVLDDTEREVLRLRFEEDMTQSKIAEHVGYSQMHVSRILRRALSKLREIAEEREP
ncbi:MAG TPA: SigB/SigF/SigG family RNA polymerase sigma factor [Solirubrobacterales bacterium]|nr:SigB/SigF/SigG family RNA polymerase sigma factor [Solirubrobacterales bacterium]